MDSHINRVEKSEHLLTETKVSEQKKRWTVMELIRWSTEYLRERGFNDSRLTVELLLAHALGCRRLDLYLQFEKPLTEEELASFKSLLLRRLKHEPVQYILGEAHFMGFSFTVEPGVLIPRPETEILVGEALKYLSDVPTENPRVLDVCTGSGNIAISLAKMSEKRIQVDALDVSREALRVAAKNIEKHGVSEQVQLVHADVMNDQLASLLDAPYDLIVSNPPYVPTSEITQLEPEIQLYEPLSALNGGEDGMRYISRIVKLTHELLLPQGMLIFEVGHDEAEKARALCDNEELVNVHIVKDYSGIERVVIANRK
ncbi:MAG: peptide chain release factor N(5)-glutamine methyltransferase [Bacteroidota bacterium]